MSSTVALPRGAIAEIFIPLRMSIETNLEIRDKLIDLADSVSEGFSQAAAAAGYQVRNTGLFDREGFIPALSRVAQLDLRAHAHLDLAQTALALERYRLATGKLPQQLQDLVPQYLAQVPTDPFDGNPIRYRLGSPGYVLYSVSEDGRDNGGRERDDKDREAPYDLCFIVTR